MTFLMIILTFVLFYYLFVVVIRYLVPYLLRRQFRKTQERFYRQTNQNENESRQGDSNFGYSKNKKSAKKDDDLGEYVDYEEIKD